MAPGSPRSGAAACGWELYAIGGSSNDGAGTSTSDLACVEKLQLSGDSVWESVRPLSARRSGCAAAVVRGSLYVLGGDDGTRALRTAERFVAASGCWEELEPMREARAFLAAAASEDCLFVVGGQDSDEVPLRSCERLALRGAEEAQADGPVRWERLPPLPLARTFCAAAYVDVYGVHVVGGRSQDVVDLDRLDCLVPGGTAWQQLSPLPTPRAGCAAVAFGTTLYVCAGELDLEPLATVECFDAEQRLWHSMPQLGVARTFCAAAVAPPGILLVLGGEGETGKALSSVERLDLSSQRPQWCPLPAMLQGRRDCAAAIAVAFGGA
eukprot:TRINITY_DN66949_c0_g1_i1.p2 TRINITY_DN66949_c0_g1~~TRINITY_DN66949_c0_g1_i1.p2  ORF type:complete len:363 (+),score=87.42 TRINITY_DN66949_c0_g1_i1:116-1090(+)